MSNGKPPDLAQQVKELKATNAALNRERLELLRLNEALRTEYLEGRFQIAMMVKIVGQAIDERNQAIWSMEHGH